MSLKIRLRQQGRSAARSYRVVVADSRLPRDGKYLEKVGFYNPTSKAEDNATFDHERLSFWIGKGAVVSENVRSLIARAAPEVYKSMVVRETAKREKTRKQNKARRAAKKSA